MRITKRQLRRITLEAMGPDHSRYGNDPLYVTTSDVRGHGQPTGQHPADEEEVEWEIGDKVVANGYPGVIEYVDPDGMVDVRLKRGVVSVSGSTIARQLSKPPLNQHFKESKMRITKKQLKRIIKEEKAKLQEQAGGDIERLLYDVLIPTLRDNGVSGPEVIETLHAAADLYLADMKELIG